MNHFAGSGRSIGGMRSKGRKLVPLQTVLVLWDLGRQPCDRVFQRPESKTEKYEWILQIKYIHSIGGVVTGKEKKDFHSLYVVCSDHVSRHWKFKGLLWVYQKVAKKAFSTFFVSFGQHLNLLYSYFWSEDNLTVKKWTFWWQQRELVLLMSLTAVPTSIQIDKFLTSSHTEKSSSKYILSPSLHPWKKSGFIIDILYHKKITNLLPASLWPSMPKVCIPKVIILFLSSY